MRLRPILASAGVLLVLAVRGPAAPVPQRIVSLAPSATESLFAVGLGPKVVGVTSYCAFPVEADRLPEVGGYMTPSYEAIAALRPDLIGIVPEHEDLLLPLAALGVEVVRLDHRSVTGVLEGLILLGTRGGVADRARALVSDLQAQLRRVEKTMSGRPRPRVLMCMGRLSDGGVFRSATGVGPGGLHDDLIARAGGANAIESTVSSYPRLSAEGLLQLDPDVIVEFSSSHHDARTLRDEWTALGSLRAVRDKRVFVFTEDFLSVPGPRLLRFIEVLARALHPDAKWEAP